MNRGSYDWAMPRTGPPTDWTAAVVDFLRRGWFWFWIVALALPIVALLRGDISWGGALIGIGIYLFIALTSRFLFTGRWRG